MPNPLPLDAAVQGSVVAPPLLLLHAGGMTHHEWDPFLGAWKERFRIVAPSAPGHGASPAPPDLTLGSMAEAVLRLLDNLEIARTHVVGSSMGGATALRLALRAPERVDRLVLYRSGYRVVPSMQAALERMATPENWRQWRMERWMEREHAPQGGPTAWQAVIRRVAELFERPDASLSLADLARVAAPTLLIGGDRDPLVPLDDLIAMGKTIPAAATWVVPDAAHVMGMETWRRQAFTEEIARFLLRPDQTGLR